MKKIMVIERRTVYADGNPWSQECKTLKEARELVASMEQEDQYYGEYAPNGYEIVITDTNSSYYTVAPTTEAVDNTMVDKVVAELNRRAAVEGNGFKITRKSDNKDMWIWYQDNGYAVYFNDGNIWRDKSQDEAPIHFDTIVWLALYLMQ